MRITTNYHTIYSPDELNSKLNKLQMAGALAKLLGEDKLYCQLKDSFYLLKNQWESQASELCKQKTKTNWLGGGDVYRYIALYDGDFESDSMKVISKSLENSSKQQLIDWLNQSIREINKKY